MLSKNYSHPKGQFDCHVHSINSLSLQGNTTLRNIPYRVHIHFKFNGDVIELGHTFVTRTDTYTKEATHEQKKAVAEVVKGVAIDFYCAYNELFNEAEGLRVAEGLKRLQKEAVELEKALNAKRDEIARYRLDNNLF